MGFSLLVLLNYQLTPEIIRLQVAENSRKIGAKRILQIGVENARPLIYTPFKIMQLPRLFIPFSIDEVLTRLSQNELKLS